jgi:hypothetical protein
MAGSDGKPTSVSADVSESRISRIDAVPFGIAPPCWGIYSVTASAGAWIFAICIGPPMYGAL